jgi:hypothetical protein
MGFGFWTIQIFGSAAVVVSQSEVEDLLPNEFLAS